MVLFIIQVLLALISVIVRLLVSGGKGAKNFDFYLKDVNLVESESIIETFIRYFILLSSLIPISLIVNLEMVRLVQAYFIIQNIDLRCKLIGRNCKVSTTTVNEELGQIEYVLTDKTGTLTQNKMILRGLIIGDRLFGGDFGLDDHGDKAFKMKSKTEFDPLLEHYLRDQTHEKLPYPMDLAKFKIPGY